MKYLTDSTENSSNPLRKLLTFIATVAIAGVLLMFSVATFIVILCVGMVAGVYVWWKTRELRKQMRDFSSSGVATGDDVVYAGFARGEVIEGEVIHVTDPQDTK